MKTWFSIKAQQSDSPAEISIHDAIGSWNISAQSFLAQLKTITSKQITLTMNTPGGSVMDGIAIYNGLRNHAEKTGAVITVKVLGVVASIGSIIAMAGDKIVMPKNTFMMIHSPSAPLYANATEMRDMADLLDKFESSLISTYVARTGKTAEEIKAMLDAETFMTADEALAMGFADEVTDALTVEASFDLDNLPEKIVNIFKAAENKANEPTTPEVTKPEQSVASQIDALATSLGLQAHVETWLLDTAIQNVDQAKASMLVACEVKELCAFAKVPDMAATLIENKSSLDEARSKILAAKADAADKTSIDNHAKPSSKPPTSAPQAAKTTAEIYAARKPK